MLKQYFVGSLTAFAAVAAQGVYQTNDLVPVYVNSVGPFFNPAETYLYYSLPFCQPDDIEKVSAGLAGNLAGDRVRSSGFQLNFGKNEDNKVLCTARLTKADINKFIHAIEELYNFEILVDGLIAQEFVGYLEEQAFPHAHHTSLYTHTDFTIGYNGNQVIDVTVTMRDLEELFPETEELRLKFTYSVTWQAKPLSESQRDKQVHNQDMFPRTLEVHWLSVINSIMLVALLTGCVSIILLRILKQDIARYNRMGDEEDFGLPGTEEYGWKLIHGDVFRFPEFKRPLCAIVGAGSQFIALAIFIMVLAILDIFNVHRHGALNAAAVVLYAMSSCVAGYISGFLYKQMGGDKWVSNALLTASVFVGPFLTIWSIMNSVAWSYGSTQAIPLGTAIGLAFLWVFVGFPGCIVGSVLGKNRANPMDVPSRTKMIPREIPATHWLRSWPLLSVLGGILPFCAICIELYYVFATVFGRQPYTLFGILLIVFVILMCVTACMTIMLIYFQLSAEDYRWWWNSVWYSGSTSLFIFLYGVYYFEERSSMSGVVQTTDFFGNLIIGCYIFFLMLGTVGFFSAFVFVRYIYSTLKTD
eukprot:Clim_evm28s6 gene=Clim_evmTU28s6